MSKLRVLDHLAYGVLNYKASVARERDSSDGKAWEDTQGKFHRVDRFSTYLVAYTVST